MRQSEPRIGRSACLNERAASSQHVGVEIGEPLIVEGLRLFKGLHDRIMRRADAGAKR